jgi:hypothetical protein
MEKKSKLFNVKKFSNMKVLAIIYFLFLIAFFVLLKITAFKNIPATEIRHKTKEVTILNRSPAEFLDDNLTAPLIHCAKPKGENFYSERLLTLSGLELHTVPKLKIEDKIIGNTIVPSLIFGDDGSFAYLLNDKPVWTSKTPRSFLDCFELKMLRSTVFKDLKTNNDSNHPFLDDWPFIFKNETDFRLHLMPLCITYASKATSSGRNVSKRKLAWTFLSGWDGTATACQSNSCKIPFSMIAPPRELHDPNNKGKIFLQNNNRLFLSLLNNGDLVVVKRVAVQKKSEEEEDDEEEKFEINFSLMEKYCM